MRASSRTETYAYSELLAPDANLISVKETLLAGRVYTKGEVLGKITVGGKFALSASAAADGSQAPDAICLETVDATGGDVEAMVGKQGRFLENRLVFGAGHTLASTREGLRDKGIISIASEVR